MFQHISAPLSHRFDRLKTWHGMYEQTTHNCKHCLQYQEQVESKMKRH